MNIKINPNKLSGKVTVPPSKSVAHRMIISAALSKGTSIVTNLYPSVDILATIDCMKSLGAKIDFEGDTATVTGITEPPKKAILDCHESGSTLRFLIPVACALGVECTFLGSAKLPTRPITPYLDQFPKHGIEFDFSKANDGEFLPLTVKGKLTAGKFEIDGGISSQFITGLIFALPLLEGDSEIYLTSHLESKPYVDITLGCLKNFYGQVTETEQGYLIKGSQTLKACDVSVEGDYSQAAFYRVANALGSDIEILGLNENSYQGDKAIMEICKNAECNGKIKPFNIDCSDIPDLVPILTVLATFADGKSEITNVARLRIKECDRLEAISTCLNSLGAKVKAFDDRLEIEGVDTLSGSEVYAYNDHRIAMSMAIASTKCIGELTVKGAECVRKSYPNFFEHFEMLGGKFEKI